MAHLTVYYIQSKRDKQVSPDEITTVISMSTLGFSITCEANNTDTSESMCFLLSNISPDLAKRTLEILFSNSGSHEVIRCLCDQFPADSSTKLLLKGWIIAKMACAVKLFPLPGSFCFQFACSENVYFIDHSCVELMSSYQVTLVFACVRAFFFFTVFMASW